MPTNTNGTYVAPTWVNDNEPALDADELNAMSGAIAGAVEYDRSMSLSSSQQETARTNIGAASQADMTQAQADILALQQAIAQLQANSGGGE